MKSSKCLFIFILLPILIALLIAGLWCILVPEDIKNTVGILRWRRNPELLSHRSPEWIDQMIQTNSNKSSHRLGENVLLNALGQLEISGPENIMTYISMDSPCKKMRPHLNVFKRYEKDIPDKSLYVHLLKAVKKFYSIYCGRDRKYQKLFADWKDQLLGLHEQFIDCEGVPDWYEDSNATSLCETASNIVNCYYDYLVMETSKSVAKAWKYIFQSVLNEAMTQPCRFSTSKEELSIFSSSLRTSSKSSMTFIALFASFLNFLY